VGQVAERAAKLDVLLAECGERDGGEWRSNMTVYLVILEDRHIDVRVEVFAKKVAAIARAEEIAEDYYYYESEEKESANPKWLFQARLSGEGDFIHVESAEVQ
jgi:hypothetical protein